MVGLQNCENKNCPFRIVSENNVLLEQTPFDKTGMIFEDIKDSFLN